ncbi:2'-5' RNA ligase family protein [Nonomuraea polychroma]|uniref:2'-5' RNA ligase family protein n=1 Tax=Nonomuraea polychroma TaxID=46176 RepID=UPI003D900FF6
MEEAEPLVGHWRRRFDASASAGVPAHVTVLVPFLDIDRMDPEVMDVLKALIGEHSPFTIRFDKCQRFPGVLYLAPTPDQPFRALTEAVAARWPEAPPYGGQYAEIIPHLTVAHSPVPVRPRAAWRGRGRAGGSQAGPAVPRRPPARKRNPWPRHLA